MPEPLDGEKLEGLNEEVRSLITGLQSQVETMGEKVKGVDAISEENTRLKGQIDNLTQSLVDLRKTPTPANAAAVEDNLKDLDPVLVDYHRRFIMPLVKRVEDNVGAEATLLRDDITVLNRATTLDREINACARRHKEDFDETLPEMHKLSKENPNYNVEQLYKLATTDIKERTAAKEKLDGERREKEIAAGSEKGGGSGTGLKKSDAKTTKEAVHSSFDEVFNPDGSPKTK